MPQDVFKAFIGKDSANIQQLNQTVLTFILDVITDYFRSTHWHYVDLSIKENKLKKNRL